MDTINIAEIEQALLAWWIIFCAMLLVVICMIIVVVWTWCRYIMRKDPLTNWTCCRCIKSNDSLIERDVELQHTNEQADQSTPLTAPPIREDSNSDQRDTRKTPAAIDKSHIPAHHHINPESTVLFCDPLMPIHMDEQSVAENLETSEFGGFFHPSQTSTDVHHHNIPKTENLDCISHIMTEISTDIHQQTILKTENPAENSHSMTDDEEQTNPKSRMIQDKNDLFPKIQTVPHISYLIPERNDQTAPICKPEVALFIDEDIKETTPHSDDHMEKIPLLGDRGSNSGKLHDTQGECRSVASTQEGATARRVPEEHSENTQKLSVGENVSGQNQVYYSLAVPSENIIDEQEGTKTYHPESYVGSEHDTNDQSREHTFHLDKYEEPSLTGNQNQ